jgi:hypothetical protein
VRSVVTVGIAIERGSGRDQSARLRDSDIAARRPVSLLLLNLEAVRPYIDAHAFRLFAILIKFIPHNRNDNYQGTHDQIESIAARQEGLLLLFSSSARFVLESGECLPLV